MFGFDDFDPKEFITKAVTAAAFLSVAGAVLVCIYGQNSPASGRAVQDPISIRAEAAAEDSAVPEEAPEEDTMEETAVEDTTAEEQVPEEEVEMGEIREDPPAPLLPYEEAGLTRDDWRLILVNRDNEIPEGYEVVTVQSDHWQKVDEWVADDLEEMLEDCRSEGYSPFVCSGFRTSDKQVSLFEADVRKFRSQGYSREEAEELTARSVAIPGTSEHEIGLAVDIVSKGNQRLDRSQEDTGTQQWLMENSWQYGFVLRYPDNKEDITGIGYEPWHYRYVGREAAKYMYEHDLCLEEFLGVTEEQD